jgi:hypothetical protein
LEEKSLKTSEWVIFFNNKKNIQNRLVDILKHKQKKRMNGKAPRKLIEELKIICEQLISSSLSPPKPVDVAKFSFKSERK